MGCEGGGGELLGEDREAGADMGCLWVGLEGHDRQGVDGEHVTMRGALGRVRAVVPDPAEVESPGMSQATQCQNPDPVGASGSKQVTAKERVPSGAPDQLRSGERFSPPRSSTSCWAATTEPSGVAAEVRVKEPVSVVL